MRRIGLWLGGLALLLGAALAAAALLLPRYVDTPAMRERIAGAVREASGRELRYAALSAGLLPPRLEVKEPVVEALVPGAPPLFAADSVSLRVSLLPLLAGAVVLESLDVEGANLHLVREAAAPPAQPPQAAADPAPDAAPDPAPDAAPGGATAPAGASPPRLGVDRIHLAKARITLEDRTLTPPATLVVEDLAADARREGDRVVFDATARLASGGEVALAGSVGADSASDTTATLARLDTRALAPWLSGARKPKQLAGLLGGTVRAKAAGATLERVDADLVLEEASLEIENVRLEGRLAITANLAPVAGGLGGDFQIDATGAELAYGDAFRKPAGTAATTSGTLVPAADGSLAVDELRVKIKNFDARGSLRTGSATTLALDAPAFDVAGWEALLPALAGSSLGGRLAVADLRLVTPPTRLGGAIVLEGVRVAARDQPPVTLQGRLVGAGDALRSEGLSLLVADQPVALDVAVAPLSAGAAFTLVATGRNVDTSALLGAFSKEPPPLSGPLRFDARFHAPLGGPKPLLEALAGTLDFEIAPGRFRGVSMLKDTIERSGPLVQASVSAGKAFGGRDLQRLYSDEFQSLSAHCRVSDGEARFDPLRVVHETHRIDVRGRVDLATRGLDASGEISFPDEKRAGALRGQTLPISHIGGTLDKPKVELSAKDVAAMASKVGGSAIEEKLGGLLDKLGGSKGQAPLDAIQGFFGGKRKSKP